MTARARVTAIALASACLVVLGAAPAFAPFARTAAEAINVTEACPSYLSLEVVTMAPDPGPHGPTVTIQAYSPPPTATSPGRLVLDRTVRVREVEPDLNPIANEPESFFGFHGRAVLFWDTGRLAPGAEVAVGPPDVFEDPPQDLPIVRTVSQRCDTPGLRFAFVRSQSTAQVLTWRVRNPNPTAVEFNAEVLGTRPAQVVLGTAPPNSEVTFQTNRVPGLNVVLLFVGGKLVNLGVAL
jgi:hypothetical protein